LRVEKVKRRTLRSVKLLETREVNASPLKSVHHFPRANHNQTSMGAPSRTLQMINASSVGPSVRETRSGRAE
jgi:hypothetical protein